MLKKAPGPVQKTDTLFPLPAPIAELERRCELKVVVSPLKKGQRVVLGQMAFDLDLPADISSTIPEAD